MLALFLAGLVPVQRLNAVRFGVVAKHQLQNVPFAYSHLLHQRVNQSPALPGNTRRHSRHFGHSTAMSQFLHLRGSNLRPEVAGAQETSHHRGMVWHKVAICGTILKQLLGFGIEFVAGLVAAVGLFSNEQRPAPGESQLPLSGCCFFGCRI